MNKTVLLHRTDPAAAMYQIYSGLAVELMEGTPAAGTETSEKALLVASPCSKDGRTVVAVNMALAAASLGYRTVLVDADLIKPDVASLLGLVLPGGLADAVLKGKNPCDFVVPLPREGPSHPEAGVLVPDADHGLMQTGVDVLGAGSLKEINPYRIVSGNGFRRVLADLGEAYDLVVIDSAPLVQGSYVQSLVRAAGRVLGVARAEMTSRSDLRAFRESVLGNAGNLAGLVFNDTRDFIPRFIRRML